MNNNSFNDEIGGSMVQCLSIINFPMHEANDGNLVVVENDMLPFLISRVFMVTALNGATRGQHAHKECAQVLVCSYGNIEVLCDNGREQQTFALESPNMGLLIPPGIWAEQRYKVNSSVLTVFCDREYDENDYIRDYDEYMEYRASLKIPHFSSQVDRFRS